MVVDRNGNPIEVGHKVRIFYDDQEPVDAVVVKLFEDVPTVLQAGHWLDVDSGEGPHGTVSYKLEILS